MTVSASTSVTSVLLAVLIQASVMTAASRLLLTARLLLVARLLIASRRILVFLQEGLCLASRSVLVVGMFLHVDGPESFGFVDERPLFRFGKQFPLGASPFADFAIVHLWILLCHLTPLTPRPDHEGIHRPLDPVQVVVLGSSRSGCGGRCCSRLTTA